MRWIITLVAAMLLALGIGLFFWQGTAYPHSWYDYECCSERDCRATTLGEVVRQDDGWLVVSTGEVIAFQGDKRLRHSLDPLTHVCLMSQIFDGKPTLRVRCLYIAGVAG